MCPGASCRSHPPWALPTEAPELGSASGLLLLAGGLGHGARWPSRAGAHRVGGRQARPQTRSNSQSFHRKVAACLLMATLCHNFPSPGTAEQAEWSWGAGWAPATLQELGDALLVLPGPGNPCPGHPGLSSQCSALRCSFYFVPWPGCHHHTLSPCVSGRPTFLGSSVCSPSTPQVSFVLT